MDGHLEIPPCVPQDIGPLGPLPKNSVLEDSSENLAETWETTFEAWLK